MNLEFSPSRRTVIAAASAASLAVVGVAGVGAAAAHNTVTLEVDGVSQPVSGFSRTVSDVINAAGVEVSPHDLVAPAMGEGVSNGDTVVVRTASPYTVDLDGNQVELWSTAGSMADLLDEFSQHGTAIIAADRSFARATLPLAAPGERIKVEVDGQTLDTAAETGDDTASILARLGVTTSPLDRVKLENRGGTITIIVTRVERGYRTQTDAVPFQTEERKDDTLIEGTTSVIQEGKDGSVTTKYFEEKVGGEIAVSAAVSTSKTDPQNKIVAVGTKKAAAQQRTTASTPTAAPATTAGSDVWAALAQCESGGNPATNTGNGFYGMYQFTLPTWQSMGGAGLPSDASAAEQTARAQALQAAAGWGQWPACAASLGLY